MTDLNDLDAVQARHREVMAELIARFPVGLQEIPELRGLLDELDELNQAELRLTTCDHRAEWITDGVCQACFQPVE